MSDIPTPTAEPSAPDSAIDVPAPTPAPKVINPDFYPSDAVVIPPAVVLDYIPANANQSA